jgi:hypothetical protein
MSPRLSFVSAAVGATFLALAIAVEAGQGVVRGLFTVPNSGFIVNPSGDTITTIRDSTGSIAAIQTSINNARVANASAIIVAYLESGATYTVTNAGLILSSNECLVATGATIQAASSSVTVPLVQIGSGAANVSVSGGTFNGNGASINAIQALAANRVNVDKVVAKNCGLDCILLEGNGDTIFDNEMTVTRCDCSGSPLHSGISIQNATQALVVDNNCHNNLVGVWLSSTSYSTVANNSCELNTTGIEVNSGTWDNVLNNTCNTNSTGILAAGSGTMVVSDALGGNTTAGISSTGSGNFYIDNLFNVGNATSFSSGGSGDHVVAYQAPLGASGQNYFYPPLIGNQHTTNIVNGMGRTDLTIGSDTIADVQTQYNNARSANPGNVIVLHLTGTYTVTSEPLNLYSYTCVLLSGTIQINSSTGSSAAIAMTNSPGYVSISGGTVDGGNQTNNNGINVTGASMLQIDSMTLRNFGADGTREGGSDVIHFSGGSAPYIVTRCTINGGAARAIWSQLDGVRAVYSDNEMTAVNEDGVDCDSGTSGAVVKFNYCHDLVRYGVFFEQRDEYDTAIGNICNNDGRDLNCYNNAEPGSPTQYNTMAFNACNLGGNCIRSGSTGTNTTTSHNFFFNNTGIGSSGDGIEGDATGTQNYYSQNYLANNSTEITTSGSEAFFNPPVVTNSPIQDSNSGLDAVVQGNSNSSGAAIVTGTPTGGIGSDGWALVPTDSGWYRVANQNSGLAMVVQGASTSPGASIIQYPYAGTTNDEWQPKPVGNGLYNLVNRLSGLYLDVPGGSLTPGTQLDQQTPTGGANQEFSLSSIVVSTNSFSLSASPQSQSVFIGGSASYTVNVTTNNGFAGAISFGVTGLPANTGASFAPPSLSGNGSSTLTITTSNNTPAGNYTLTIDGTNGANVFSTAAVLTVNALANAGTLLWTGASDLDQNWSTALNWTNITAAGYGPPGLSNSILFTNIAAVSISALTYPGSGVVNSGSVNNFANGSFAISALTNLANAPNTAQVYQNIGVAAGATLSLTNNLEVGGFTGLDFGGTNIANLTISGAGATLSESGSGVIVSADSANTGPHNAVLDLSGLDTFTMNGTQIRLGVEGSGNAHHSSGIMYLARTNNLTVLDAGYTTTGADGVSPYSGNPALYIGHNGSAFGNGSQLYLGDTNAIFVDYATIGRGDTNVLLAFNPSVIGSGAAALIRGTNGGSTRVGVYVVGDVSSGAASNGAPSTNDFSGGAVDAMINYLCVGRGREGNNSSVGGAGVLTFNDGTINANTAVAGWLYASGSNSQATGTINVNGSGNLIVNTSLMLSSAVLTTNNALTKGQGTLNINGGTADVGSITAGGGTATVTMNSGTLEVTNSAGTPSSALTAFNLTNSMLVVNLNGGAIITNVNALTMNASGLNNISVASAANLATATTFPIIAYGTLNGSVAGNFVLGSIPLGYRALLVNNAGQKRIDLLVAPAPATPPAFNSETLSGGNLNVGGTNGPPGWTYYVLSSTNIGLPVSQWVTIGTNAFDGSGNFSFHAAAASGGPQSFYLLKLQ